LWQLRHLLAGYSPSPFDIRFDCDNNMYWLGTADCSGGEGLFSLETARDYVKLLALRL
jgi:hypothetical protein